jgi:hypothetical protein
LPARRNSACIGRISRRLRRWHDIDRWLRIGHLKLDLDLDRYRRPGSASSGTNPYFTGIS